jgi:hypothetical protein
MRTIFALALAASCSSAPRPTPALSNRVDPPCGGGDEVARKRVPDGGYFCRVSIDERQLPWFACRATSSDDYSILQWSNPQRCRFSGIVRAQKLEAEISCATPTGVVNIFGTTQLRSVANGWEAEAYMATDGQATRSDDLHRVSIVVCKADERAPTKIAATRGR